MIGLLFVIVLFTAASTTSKPSPTISSDAVRFPTQLLEKGEIDISKSSHTQSKSISTTNQRIHPIAQLDDAGNFPTELNSDPKPNTNTNSDLKRISTTKEVGVIRSNAHSPQTQMPDQVWTPSAIPILIPLFPCRSRLNLWQCLLSPNNYCCQQNMKDEPKGAKW
jgi:hypothetical protein